MRVDKTLSELWSIADHEDKEVREIVKMAINTLQKLQQEHEKEYDRLRKQIYELAQEKHDALMKLNKEIKKNLFTN